MPVAPPTSTPPHPQAGGTRQTPTWLTGEGEEVGARLCPVVVWPQTSMSGSGARVHEGAGVRRPGGIRSTCLAQLIRGGGTCSARGVSSWECPRAIECPAPWEGSGGLGISTGFWCRKDSRRLSNRGRWQQHLAHPCVQTRCRGKPEAAASGARPGCAMEEPGHPRQPLSLT